MSDFIELLDNTQGHVDALEGLAVLLAGFDQDLPLNGSDINKIGTLTRLVTADLVTARELLYHGYKEIESRKPEP